MSTPEAQRTLIDEIDDRQEALLNELSSLNARVEALLNECLATREQQRLAEEEESEPASTVGELISALPIPPASAAEPSVAAPLSW